MAGIYIHIPFCKKACHYCNFHFSTSLQLKNDLVSALLKEIDLVKGKEIKEAETIYFGGGTPSLLGPEDIASIMDRLCTSFQVGNDAEITLEANPDDIELSKLEAWKANGINRLSIGVQSFHDHDLQWMNRAHSARQALESLFLVKEAGFTNFSIDLIFGIPGMDKTALGKNLQQVLDLEIPHISTYALTIEPRTALKKMIDLGKTMDIDPDQQANQYLMLIERLESAGYEHYEISSFALAGMRSRHNSSYWKGRHYIGIGPSAHSFDGTNRSWNVANNARYIESINKGVLPSAREALTGIQHLNEYIMTSLRTSEGLDLARISLIWGNKVKAILESRASRYEESKHLTRKDEILQLTRQGKLFADGIAADLFLEDHGS